MMDQSDAIHWEMDDSVARRQTQSPAGLSSCSAGPGSIPSPQQSRKTSTPHSTGGPVVPSSGPRELPIRITDKEKRMDRSSRKRRFWAVAVGWHPGIYQVLDQLIPPSV